MIRHILNLAQKWRPFSFYANYEFKICNTPLNNVKLGLGTPDVSLKCYVLEYNKHFGNNMPKLMILAAILFLCKLVGQDVKINFGIRYF